MTTKPSLMIPAPLSACHLIGYDVPSLYHSLKTTYCENTALHWLRVLKLFDIFMDIRDNEFAQHLPYTEEAVYPKAPVFQYD